MATLVLSAVGTVLGGVFGPVGALVGRGLGALAGGLIDNYALNALSPATHVQGPRLKDLQVQASTEGAPIPRIYGRVRLAGQIIWATRLEEVAHTERHGGKGGGPKVKTTTYRYFANFAIALCEGPVARIERVWADGKPLDVEADGIVMRFYPGDEAQSPDPLIVAKEGADNAPAYRGVAYVVFERLALEKFGNRIPQLSFEVVRPVDDVAEKVRAVNIIPGAGEFFCDPEVVTRAPDTDAPLIPGLPGLRPRGEAENENAHATEKRSDWAVSIDQLQAAAPNLDAAALVASWFGDDLRCGHCAIRPKVEVAEKITHPEEWRVAGLTRADAETVSTHDGRPAYGGTPSDNAVIRAIRDLHARGLKPVLYPFVMMDIPIGNALPDPYTGAAGQPSYPWRGRITCDPAPGRSASPDKSADVNAQLAAFIGTAQPSDFGLDGDEVIYSGPGEWSYRRFILHYAWLAKAAGDVHAFLIGSELRGLTWLRDGPGTYPFVQALKQLAADVKAILGPSVKVGYAADWSEWFGHHPQDGSGDVYFHLDPLWSDANIDFIGIDNYMPLSDWRAGVDHLDAQAGADGNYDQDYLKANIAGGEGYDWYYANAADRDVQARTPITDGAHDKPWVFRYKDILNWWKNPHHDRPGGVESATPTAWVPESKPIWFTEAGCPALDKGANQPNVFFDPKSSESALPHFSSGRRDDAMQKAYMRALMDYWSAPGAHNPVSGAYGGPMVDPSRIFFWAWDARPYPWYPALADVWGDTDSYEHGHWLNGRLDAVSVETLIAAILDDWDFPANRRAIAATGAQVTGYVIDRPMSARAALEPLLTAFAVDVRESGQGLQFFRRQVRVVADVATAEVVETGAEAPLFEQTRAEVAEVPRAITFISLEEAADHAQTALHLRATAQGGIVSSGAIDAGREPSLHVTLPASLPQAVAGGHAAVLLKLARAGRERLALALGPHHLALEPGDVFRFRGRQWRIERIVEEGPHRRVEAVLQDPLALEPPPFPARRRRDAANRPLPVPFTLLLDVPRLRDAHDAKHPYAAAYSRPWPGAVALKKQGGESAIFLEAPAIVGELLDELPAALPWLFQRGVSVRVRLFRGALESVTEEALFAGANAAAIGDESTGVFEVVQFRNAVLEAENVWRLSMFLRGQRGSEPELASWPAGSRFVLLNGALAQAAMVGLPDIGLTLSLRAGPASRDEADETWATFQAPFTGRALRPLHPVHLRARKLVNGDIRFTWVRRSRLPEAADVWGAGEAPLAETAERYLLKIVDGAEVRRAQETTAPEYLWTAAQQAADFPSGLPPTLTVRVAQVSEVFGPGAWQEEVIHV